MGGSVASYKCDRQAITFAQSTYSHGSYRYSSRGFEPRNLLWEPRRHKDHFVLTSGLLRSGLSAKGALRQQTRSAQYPLL